MKSTEHYTYGQWKQNQCEITGIIKWNEQLVSKSIIFILVLESWSTIIFKQIL
jgi:hypothetical protein